MPQPERLYNEHDIQDLLRRAYKLEQQHAPSTPTTGLTLEEVQQIAAEVGLTPASIREAAYALEEHPPETSDTLWGGPFVVHLDKTISGCINDNDWEAMLTAIRGTFHDTGRIVQRGTTREWHHSGRSGVHAHVTVHSQPDQTHIHIFHEAAGLPFVTYTPLLTLSLILTGMTGAITTPDVWGGIMLFLAYFSTAFLIARWLTSRSTSRHHQEVHHLMHELQQHVATGMLSSDQTAATVSSSAAVSSSTAQPLTLDTEAPEPTPLPHQRQRTR